MTEALMKSIEYTYQYQEANYLVKALIVSAPEDLEFTNIDFDEYASYMYRISLQTDPLLSHYIMHNQQDLLLLLGSNENIQIGYIVDDTFSEFEENEFWQILKVKCLEVLLIAGNTGHFKDV